MADQLRFCWLMCQGKTLLETVAGDLDGIFSDRRFTMGPQERCKFITYRLTLFASDT